MRGLRSSRRIASWPMGRFSSNSREQHRHGRQHGDDDGGNPRDNWIYLSGDRQRRSRLAVKSNSHGHCTRHEGLKYVESRTTRRHQRPLQLLGVYQG